VATPEFRARGFDAWHDASDAGDAQARAARVLADVGLAGKERVRAKSLSYGDRRALEIGVALAADPALLFLDEPTAGLGAEGIARVSELISRLRRRVTLVVIEHDMRFLFGLADRISVVHWGQVIARGTPEELRDNPWVRRSDVVGWLVPASILALRRWWSPGGPASPGPPHPSMLAPRPCQAPTDGPLPHLAVSCQLGVMWLRCDPAAHHRRCSRLLPTMVSTDSPVTKEELPWPRPPGMS